MKKKFSLLMAVLMLAMLLSACGGDKTDGSIGGVGGGNSAAADALYLSRLAAKVYIVHRRNSLKAERLYHEPLTQSPNVEFIWNSTVSKLIADGRVTGAEIKNVHTQNVKKIDCDGIFVSIGRKPASEFLNNAVAVDSAGYVIADESTKTNVKGVFAAGDIRTKYLRQIVTAVADGAVAIHFAEEYLAENESI